MSRNLSITAAFGVLFATSIPWYWSLAPSLANSLWMGFPVWVLTSVGGAFLIACLTARILAKPWDGEGGDAP